MADATPPTPPTPRAAAKGLSGVFKGKPAWLWVAGITVLLGVAYLTLNRKNEEDPSETGGGEYTDDGQMAVGDYGGYYPVATQGAYGGYDEPQDWAPVTTDNAGEPEPSPITVNVTYPAPVAGGKAPTGGGTTPARGTPNHKPVRKWGGHPLAWWQNPKNARKRVKVKGRWVHRWRWPGGGGYKHTRPFAGRG
jgi:hypothetical protein